MQLTAKPFQWGKCHPAGTGSPGGTRVLCPALLAFKARHHLLLLSSCPCHQPDPIAHPPQISAPWFAATGRTGLNRKPTPKRGFASPQHLLGLVLYITFSPKARMRPPWSNVALASQPRPSHTCCCETGACRCFAPGLSSAPPDPVCGCMRWHRALGTRIVGWPGPWARSWEPPRAFLPPCGSPHGDPGMSKAAAVAMERIILLLGCIKPDQQHRLQRNLIPKY